VRFPLLLRYGGVYADVGVLLIGDFERLWNEIIADPGSKYEVFSYSWSKDRKGRNLANYLMAALPGNAFFERCHKLLLALWDTDGGKTTTTGLHAHPLLKGIPLMGEGENTTIKDADGKILHGPEEVSKMVTDYGIQGAVMTAVAGLIDAEDSWNGPEYWVKHVYAPNSIPYSQMMNMFTSWNGRKSFELMSLPLPKEGEQETEDQRLARVIVERHLGKSHVVKLWQGFVVKVLGDTLGSLWAKNGESDNVPGTYAHWLRHGTVYWCPDELPPTLEFEFDAPTKIGPLLREA
jgi:hypothetical protein